MDTRTRQNIIAEIVDLCDSLEWHELDALSDEELQEIDATDTRWCNSYEETSSALFASYEAIVGEI